MKGKGRMRARAARGRGGRRKVRPGSMEAPRARKGAQSNVASEPYKQVRVLRVCMPLRARPSILGGARSERSCGPTCAPRARRAPAAVDVVDRGEGEVKVDHVLHMPREVEAARRHVRGHQHRLTARTLRRAARRCGGTRRDRRGHGTGVGAAGAARGGVTGWGAGVRGGERGVRSGRGGVAS